MRGALLPPPRRRAPADAAVPTVNVAFLLLIFFLLTARIAPPSALEVTPPSGAGQAIGAAARVVELDAAGTLAFGGARGEAALAALARGEGPVLLRADAGAPAQVLADVLPRLAGSGRVELEVRPR